MGMITANSFMKREFGKKLIEDYLPRKDLTHVVDTSGAFIPGHSTPTIILFARNQVPKSDQIQVVLGIRGEPGVPELLRKEKFGPQLCSCCLNRMQKVTMSQLRYRIVLRTRNTHGVSVAVVLLS